MTYRVLEVKSAGTYGIVVKAVRLSDPDKVLGLKVLNAKFLTDERVLRRMRDEARILAQLNHPNILRVDGFTTHLGHPILEMEWIRGVTLFDLTRRLPKGLPPAIAVEIIRTASLALHHAFWHPTGSPPKPLQLLHRDIKPNNLMISANGVIKLIDFGLARGEYKDRESNTVSMVLGSRHYVAPERLDGEDDTLKIDVYALGMLLFELLTSRRMRLSLNQVHHEQRLSAALGSLEFPRMNKGPQERLRKLIAGMVAYNPEHRLNHGEVTEGLGVFLASAVLSPNMRSFAHAHVLPLLTASESRDQTKRAHYQAVKFLEADERN